MGSFREWLNLQEGGPMNFGYPDGYGVAFYPMAYHPPAQATSYIQMQFRQEQEDMAPPDTALPDPAGDKSQKKYRNKYGVLPKFSGKGFLAGYGHHADTGIVYLHEKPRGHHIKRPTSPKKW